MTLRRARSIDSLHEEIAGADIVLSAEAPLTLALDRRVESPRIGRLAATPRSHASGELVPTDRRPLFAQIVDETELNWKQATRALDLWIDCWNQTGERHGITEYPEFHTPAVQTVIDTLEDEASSYDSLATTHLDPTDDIRVIDERSLTPLDRSLLPEPSAYETVDPFDTGTASLPEIHRFASATAIVDTIVAQIEPETAEHVGIVLDQGSVYSPLFESTFEAQGIPYQGGPGFIDADEIRTFLRLLRASFAGSDLRVQAIRPLLSRIGVDVPRTHDEKRVGTLDTPWASRFHQFQQTVREGRFRDALTSFEEMTTTTNIFEQLRAELEFLNTLDKDVTESRIDAVLYYLQSFEVPVEREQDGVLLTDAAATAYVDRPVVFYIGLGTGYAQTPQEWPWVDREQFIEQDLRRFQLLMQNGQERYAFVQATQSGDDVTPCPYLRELLDADIDSLADLPHQDHRGQVQTVDSAQGPFSEPDPPEVEPHTTISQGTLNRLTTCPREEHFTRVVEGIDSLPLSRGTVLHEAAELYVNHPESVRSDREEVVDAMVDRLYSYINDTRRDTLRTELLAGLRVIMAYLDTNPPDTALTVETYGEPKGENDLADRLGLSIDSELCERWFATPAVGGHGYVDLLQDDRTLVDFKTGSVRSATKIQQKAAIEPVADRPDFQAPLYLAQHRREQPDEQLELRFVHLLDCVDELVKGAEPDLNDLVVTITYMPQTFSEFVASEAVYETLTEYAESNNRRKVLDPLGYERYAEFFSSHPLPREGEDPDQRAETEAAFRELATQEIGDYKYVTKGCDKIFGDLTGPPPGYFLEDDLDAFEDFVEDRIAELNEYRASRFPVGFNDAEPDWQRVDNQDLILTDR